MKFWRSRKKKWEKWQKATFSAPRFSFYLSAGTEIAGEVTASAVLLTATAGDATGAAEVALDAGFWNFNGFAWPARDAKRPKIGFDGGGAINWNPSFGI